MLFALLCVFGIYTGLTRAVAEAEAIEVIYRQQAAARQRDSLERQKTYLKMVERNDLKPLSEEESEVKYFGFFENSLDLKEIINFDLAWPVFALYYAGKWAKERKDKWNEVCKLVIVSIFHFGEELSQPRFYHVMNELYDKVSESNPDQIHDLMLDFAVYFFVNRPLNRNAQKKAFLEISEKYGNPQIGVVYSNQLGELSSPYYDRFVKLFRNEKVTANYPQALKDRINWDKNPDEDFEMYLLEQERYENEQMEEQQKELADERQNPRNWNRRNWKYGGVW
eukprot:NODE_127_length_17034_cov_0.369590.p7 type:complete len:281 gc:universal NODE_127_length_17034_cov_0.369590:1323-481(-)